MQQEINSQRGWLDMGAYRLRTLLTLPSGSGRVPALLLLPPLGGRSLDVPLAPPREAMALLIGAATRAGLATLRVEPSGYGGSGGPGYAQQELAQELSGYHKALMRLRAHPRVEPSALVLFGHSLGGALAPLMAARAEVCAVVVYGAPGRSWSQALAAGAQRQLELAQVSPERAQIEAAYAAALYAGLLRRNLSPAELFTEQPPLRGCQAAQDLRGALIHGRSLTFFRALESHPVEAAWRAVDAPVLALAGEHDWVIARDDAERIAGYARATTAALSAKSADGQETLTQACTIAGLDHDMRRYDSRQASFQRRGRGPLDGAAIDRMLRWLSGVPALAAKMDASAAAAVLCSP